MSLDVFAADDWRSNQPRIDGMSDRIMMKAKLKNQMIAEQPYQSVLFKPFKSEFFMSNYAKNNMLVVKKFSPIV